MREKVEKSRAPVFAMLCSSGGSKGRLAKAEGAELRRGAYLEVKMLKTFKSTSLSGHLSEFEEDL